MKCKVHPTYKVLRKPTANCEQCRKMWEDKIMRESNNETD